jgi:hypothetical protein
MASTPEVHAAVSPSIGSDVWVQAPCSVVLGIPMVEAQKNYCEGAALERLVFQGRAQNPPGYSGLGRRSQASSDEESHMYDKWACFRSTMFRASSNRDWTTSPPCKIDHNQLTVPNEILNGAHP